MLSSLLVSLCDCERSTQGFLSVICFLEIDALDACFVLLRGYTHSPSPSPRNILWRAGSNGRVRTLMGHTTDDYFQPRVQWDPSGLFSYCNSSGDHDVHVHCLASGWVGGGFVCVCVSVCLFVCLSVSLSLLSVCVPECIREKN